MKLSIYPVATFLPVERVCWPRSAGPGRRLLFNRTDLRTQPVRRRQTKEGTI
jgi:hypothetical protein